MTRAGENIEFAATANRTNRLERVEGEEGAAQHLAARVRGFSVGLKFYTLIQSVTSNVSRYFTLLRIHAILVELKLYYLTGSLSLFISYRLQFRL